MTIKISHIRQPGAEIRGACLDCLECVDFWYHYPIGLAPFRRLAVGMSNYSERRLPLEARIARSICSLDGEHRLHPFRVRVLSW